jgi:hypothetical protein
MDNRHIVIPLSTLSSAYGNYGTAELGRNTNQVSTYIGYKAGTAGDSINVLLCFSPDNTLFFRDANEDPTNVSTKVYKKIYTLIDTALAANDDLVGEFLGVLTAVTSNGESVSVDIQNKMRLKPYLIPVTGTTPIITHNGVAFATVTERANDAAFTAVAAGTVEWSLATGNLNFSAADLVSYRGQEIRITYKTDYNLFRIPVPVTDQFLKVAISETAAGASGSGFVWIGYGPNFK